MDTHDNEAAVGALLRGRGRRASFTVAEMVDRWNWLVDAVERGYSDTVDEYTNDLSCRNWLHEAWLLLDEHLLLLWTPRIRALDDRFVAATVDDDGQALARFRRLPRAELWWWRRHPRLLTGSLGRSLRAAAAPPSYRDHLWFEERFPDLAEAYCITLAHGLPPAELLRRLGGREEPLYATGPTGTTAVVDAAFDLLGRSDGTRQLIALTTVGRWTVAIEPNGYLGVTEERALPASSGTRWISHFANINGVDTFLWAEDTTNRLCFEPTFPESRGGSTPDALLDVMRGMGFPLDPQARDATEAPPALEAQETQETGDFVVSDHFDGSEHALPAAFALAQHLTGVTLTPELLQNTPFVCGSAPIRETPQLETAR
ncbi:DUF6461 domain-containing protein [Streptomyces inhibens]|uniref:DUF6461 domain-containing protein n=1 Tax=Streptomyces inhibens TaxID=2293571 RepID=UPI001EE746EE|nr:DUF6461 domain-containing protein [Streptomyces inhibens]UKY52001.1 DUF6461 domain-containing protein [Streptomyces inhibens]